MDEIVRDNDGNFLPNGPGQACNVETSISIAQCWYHEATPGHGAWNGLLLSCVSDCCTRKYKICWGPNGRYIAGRLSSGTPSDAVECPEREEHQPPCQTICETLDTYEVTDPGSGGTGGKVVRDRTKGDMPILVSVADEQLSVHLGDRAASRIDVTDERGIIVLTQQFETVENRTIQVGLEFIPNGRYFVRVVGADGLVLDVSAVDIVK